MSPAEFNEQNIESRLQALRALCADDTWNHVAHHFGRELNGYVQELVALDNPEPMAFALKAARLQERIRTIKRIFEQPALWIRELTAERERETQEVDADAC